MKYFFGYHKVNGVQFPIKWADDLGPIGGSIKDVTQIREITLHEYRYNNLTRNCKEYPYVEVEDAS